MFLASNVIFDMLAGRLKNARKICAEGGNLTGPHTADFTVLHKQQNRSADLCSTGEQKALLISIILAEMRAQMAEQDRCPLLLLDEILYFLIWVHFIFNVFNVHFSL